MKLYQKVEKIITIDHLNKVYNSKKSYEWAFTTGCFDILHEGHLSFFLEAKSLFKYLVVAVASDEVIRTLKGKERPIRPLESRLFVLSSVEYIDYIITNPYKYTQKLASEIKINNFVKCFEDSHRNSNCETNSLSQLGVNVTQIKKTNNISTSQIIKKIKSL